MKKGNFATRNREKDVVHPLCLRTKMNNPRRSGGGRGGHVLDVARALNLINCQV